MVQVEVVVYVIWVALDQNNKRIILDGGTFYPLYVLVSTYELVMMLSMF
jgi:hypothetical protein